MAQSYIDGSKLYRWLKVILIQQSAVWTCAVFVTLSWMNRVGNDTINGQQQHTDLLSTGRHLGEVRSLQIIQPLPDYTRE